MSASAEHGVPILMYHQVADRAPAGFEKYTVSPRAFDAQMRWLAMAGYATVDLPTVLAARNNGAPLPRRPVVITFDDGFRECAGHAAPSLAAHGFTATFFLVAGRMGRTSEWLRAERGIELALMRWEDAEALAAAGHRCEGHSMTHPRLPTLTADACRDELARSRAVIEDRLGRAVRYLAYPYGSYDARVRGATADCGYEGACSVTIGLSTPADDPFALHRVPVLGGDSLLDFISRLSTAHTIRDRLRALVRPGERARVADAGGA